MKTSKKRNKPVEQQPVILTPVRKVSASRLSPSPNSNSFSQIFASFYPRTPVRKVNQQQQKDKLGQLQEKGCSPYSIVTQVTFNSTKVFENINFDFSRFQLYDKRSKQGDTEWTLLTQKQQQSYTSKTQLFLSLQSVYKLYLEEPTHFFVLSTSTFYAFFSHCKENPYALFIDRFYGELKPNADIRNMTSQFLKTKHIDSQVLAIEKPLSTLIPMNFMTFPSLYTISLIKYKQVTHLFNTLLNLALEKENMDVGGNFKFHNSCENCIQTYNGMDSEVQDTSNVFQRQGEYKVQFEGLFYVQQILDIQQSLQSTLPDVVVSDIKLNPLTTLFTKTLLNQIEEQFNQ